MLTVGLTGGIGSGKSAAADMFVQAGVTIVDADIVSREVVQPGEPALAQIAAHFGKSILLADGGLDRRALRGVIFSDPAEKRWLEQLLHPLINERIRHQLQQADSVYRMLVSPLLLETRQRDLVDRVLLIDCSPATQVQRVTQRDETSAEQVEAIMDTQKSRTERRALADDIIENEGDLAALRDQVQVTHARYLELAQQRR